MRVEPSCSMTSRSKTWPSLEPTFVHRADPPGNGQFVVWPPLSSMISCTFAPAKSTCAAVMPHSACAVPTNQQSCNSVRISPRPRTIEANVRARTQESAPIRYDPHDVVLTSKMKGNMHGISSFTDPNWHAPGYQPVLDICQYFVR